MSETAATLIVCPTPLGNLGDMPPRALQALQQADCICCEDTRVTGKLLAALGVERKRLERLDEAVLGERAARIVERAAAGERIVYCSDAGMPGVSDPGQRLVAAARDAGVPVEVLPGPTAVATAYVASGFTCPRFYFGGFFPRKQAERAAVLDGLAALDAVLLFYESPQRVASALQAVASRFPMRRVAVCRELNKLHEEVVAGPAPQVAEQFEQRAREHAIKGEIVVVVDAPSQEEADGLAQDAYEQAAQRADGLRAEGRLTGKQMVQQLQREFGISRNQAYELVHRA